MILPFRKGFIFTKLRIRKNKVLPKISKITVLDSSHWHEFISMVKSNVEPDLVLRSQLILIYTVFTTGYIWVYLFLKPIEFSSGF